MKNKTNPLLVFAIVIAVVGFTGCTKRKQAKPGIPQASFKQIAELSPEQVEQKQSAIAAKDKLFGALLSELMASMSEKGPAKSISVCKTRAPEIAKVVGEETGVRIGRTSFKLRNPDNKSPAWAQVFVDQHVETPVDVELPNGELGVLLPIHLKTTCILCHGTDDQLGPNVKPALASNYPDDEATGFAEGELRGYFWVEVPKAASQVN